MYYYAYTLRRTQQPVYIQHYDDVIRLFERNYPKATIKHYYEVTHGLHVHAIVSSTRRIYINKIHPGKGYNLDFKLIPKSEVDHWSRYIKKDILKWQHMENMYWHEKDTRTPPEYTYPRFNITKL